MIHDTIGHDLNGFGGLLRCLLCGIERPLGDTGGHLREGWPKCCGYTMRWVTRRQLAEEVGRV